ncbi:glycosyltransferase [Pilimelia terevasa]|uniref:glycosyltransferase n=1 Tax=Pilimelia terevasa TaxID=53372 RepID=UPI001E2BE892|nr:glycosyltransferase [Pilimelia terevasa]
MARRLLFLGFFLPPSRASGVYRTRALANRFAAQGWEVTALAAPLGFLRDTVGSVDDSLLATLDPRVRVLRPALDTYAWEKDLRAFGWLRRSRPRLSRRRYEWLGNLGFPEHYASWGRACVRVGLRLHRRRPFDAVLATGNPYAAFAAAWGLHRLRGLPYAVDFRDSWTLDQFGDAARYPAGHPAVRWERRIMGRAAAAVFVNEPTRQWYADRYPAAADRTLVVPNGWDPDLLDLGAVGDDPAPAGRPLRLGFLGTLTDRMPLAALAAAFRLARRSPELAGATLDLYGHLGFQQTGQPVLREALGLPEGADTSADGALRYLGPVAKTAVADVYAASDVLVFLAGGSRYVTSGKVFEYMAAGRPVVSVHAPGIAAEDVLAGYPLWFRADSLAPEALAAAMRAAADAARTAGPGPRAAAREWAARYQRDRLLTPLVDRLAAVGDARAAAR